MAELIPSPFCTYSLTKEEEKRGMILGVENLWVLQNLLAQYAKDKLELTHTPQEPYLHLQRESELQGSINAVRSIIDNHYAALEEAKLMSQTNDQFYQSAIAQFQSN